MSDDRPVTGQTGETSREEFLKRAGAAGVGLAVGGSYFTASAAAAGRRRGAVPFAGQTIRVAAYGGAWEEFMKRFQVPDFEAKTGAKVQLVTGTSASFYAQMLAAGPDNPPLDVWVTAETNTAALRAQGFFVPLPLKSVPNLNLVPRTFKILNNVGVLGLISPLGIVYRTDKIPKPTSWLDLAKYPKQVGLFAIQNAGGPQQVLKYAAILGKGRYKPNWEQGMDWIANNLHDAKQVPFSTQMAPLLTSGEVVIGCLNGTDYAPLKAKGVPLGFVKPKEGWLGMYEQDICVTRGSKVKPLAYAFVNHYLSTPVQERWVRGYFQYPANVRARIPASVKPLIAVEKDTVKLIPRWDYEWLNSGIYQKIVAAWNKQMS